VPGIAYRGDDLCCDGVKLADIAARCGTPTYVYSADAILERFEALRAALSAVPHLVCYAVKTNSSLAILDLLARAGSGFDIVSRGELHRLTHAGAPPERIVFAGVGKRADEMQAALEAGIHLFNLESIPEAELLSRVAVSRGCTARAALRINPNLAAGGHHYITTGTAAEKFGLDLEGAVEHYARVARLPGLDLCGLHCHIGSQILDVASHRLVAERLAELTRSLRAAGLRVESLNLGGGFGIRYRDERPPEPRDIAAGILPPLRDLGVRLLVEPGRSLVGNAGVLLSRVLFRKETSSKTFIVVDAGMNDLVRPSLYGAHHEVLPLQRDATRPRSTVDVVGPLCESGDFLARERELQRLESDELVGLCSAGAYGFSMSSNYNSRPRAAEVLVRGGEYRVVRARESLEDLLHGERVWDEASAQP
jgi:diaminopimelate decarboxylase